MNPIEQPTPALRNKAMEIIGGDEQLASALVQRLFEGDRLQLHQFLLSETAALWLLKHFELIDDRPEEFSPHEFDTLIIVAPSGYHRVYSRFFPRSLIIDESNSKGLDKALTEQGNKKVLLLFARCSCCPESFRSLASNNGHVRCITPRSSLPAEINFTFLSKSIQMLLKDPRKKKHK